MYRSNLDCPVHKLAVVLNSCKLILNIRSLYVMFTSTCIMSMYM